MISKKTKIALLTSGAIGGLLATSIALSSCTFDMTSSSTQGTTNTTPEFLSRDINWEKLTPGNNNLDGSNQGVYYDAEEGLAFTDATRTVLLGLNPNYGKSDVTIPDSVRVIAQYNNVTTNSQNPVVTGAFENQVTLKNVSFSGSNLMSIGNSTFKGCSNLNPFELPSSVTTIGDSAFENAFVNSANSFSFTAPSSLVSIGNNAFKNSSLKSFSLGNASKVTIGSNVFDGCTNLTSLNLSNSTISEFGDNAFQNTAFTKLVFSNGTTNNNEGELILPAYLLNNQVWAGAAGSGLLGTVNGGVFNSSKIETVTFEDGITIDKLPDFIFANMTNLKTIENLPKSIKILGKYAFANTAITDFDDKTFDYPKQC